MGKGGAGVESDSKQRRVAALVDPAGSVALRRDMEEERTPCPVMSDAGASLGEMSNMTCERCSGAKGESRAWHDSVLEQGDLDLIQHEGGSWHRKCAEDDRQIRAQTERVKRETVNRAWGS